MATRNHYTRSSNLCSYWLSPLRGFPPGRGQRKLAIVLLWRHDCIHTHLHVPEKQVENVLSLIFGRRQTKLTTIEGSVEAVLPTLIGANIRIAYTVGHGTFLCGKSHADGDCQKRKITLPTWRTNQPEKLRDMGPVYERRKRERIIRPRAQIWWKLKDSMSSCPIIILYRRQFLFIASCTGGKLIARYGRRALNPAHARTCTSCQFYVFVHIRKVLLLLGLSLFFPFSTAGQSLSNQQPSDILDTSSLAR